MSRKVLTILFLLSSLSLISACNTMEGLGKDIQKAGGALENAAGRDH